MPSLGASSKFAVAGLAVAGLVAAVALLPSNPQTFDEEFTWNTPGGPINTTRWDFNTGRWTANGELETYTTRRTNCYEDGLGDAVLKATYDSGTWDSCRIFSKFSQTGGKWEVRAKYSITPGMWPAAWFLASNYANEYAETDGFEEYGTYQVWNSSTHDAVTNYSGPSFTADANWHVYDIDYRNGNVYFYEDGVLKTQAPLSASFNQPMFMILDLAVSPAGGTPDGSSGTLTVDYVRAWENG